MARPETAWNWANWPSSRCGPTTTESRCASACYRKEPHCREITLPGTTLRHAFTPPEASEGFFGAKKTAPQNDKRETAWLKASGCRGCTHIYIFFPQKIFAIRLACPYTYLTIQVTIISAAKSTTREPILQPSTKLVYAPRYA